MSYINNLNNLIQEWINGISVSIIEIIKLIGMLYLKINYVIAIFMLIIFIVDFFRIKNKVDIKESLYHILISFNLGLIVKLADIEKLNDLFNVYMKVSLVILIFITIIFIKEILYYKQSKNKIKLNYCKMIYFFFHSVLFILTATNNLDLSIFLILSIVIIELFRIMHKLKNSKNNFEEETDYFNEILDLEINKKEQLFPSRRVQLASVKDYLKNSHYNESFAISINAEWGEGKSSFINVLVNELEEEEDTYIIFIQPMILDTKEKLINYFFSQIRIFLEKKGLYTGKGSIYKNYFELVMKMIKNKEISILSKMLGIFEEEANNDFRQMKKSLENQMKLLDYKIYIIVDDFDRVEKETIYNTLVFIKQIVSFKDIMVVFLMDDKKVKKNFITREYLDKFINKQFNLAKVDFEEMATYFFENKVFFKELYNLELINREIDILEDNICFYIKEAKEKFDYFIDTKEKLLNKNDEKLKDSPNKIIIKEELNKVKTRVDKFKINLNNPRKVKRFFREIAHIVNECCRIYEEDNDFLNNNFKELKINRTIFNISFIKVFFSEEYKKIIETGSMETYINNNTGLIKEITKELEHLDYYGTKAELNIKEYREHLIIKSKFRFYNMMILNDDEYKYFTQEIKTKYEKIIDKIDNSDKLEFKDYNELVDYIKAIDREKNNKKVTKCRFKKVINWMFSANEGGKIYFWDIIDLLSDKNISIDLLLLNIDYLNKLRNFLNNDKLYYSDEVQRKKNILTIKNLKNFMIFHFKTYIEPLIVLYKIDDDKCSYNSIKDAMKDIHDLEGMNQFIKNSLDESEIKRLSANSEQEKISKWTGHIIRDIEKEYSDHDIIDIDYFVRKIELFKELYSLINDILRFIKDKKVKINYDKPVYIQENNDLKRLISALYEDVVENNKNNDKIYRSFIRIVSEVDQLINYKEFKDENIQKIGELYLILNERLPKSYEWKEHWLSVAIEIEKIQKRQQNKKYKSVE